VDVAYKSFDDYIVIYALPKAFQPQSWLFPSTVPPYTLSYSDNFLQKLYLQCTVRHPLQIFMQQCRLVPQSFSNIFARLATVAFAF
jgi:hypothetical protein